MLSQILKSDYLCCFFGLTCYFAFAFVESQLDDPRATEKICTHCIIIPIFFIRSFRQVSNKSQQLSNKIILLIRVFTPFGQFCFCDQRFL